MLEQRMTFKTMTISQVASAILEAKTRGWTDVPPWALLDRMERFGVDNEALVIDTICDDESGAIRCELAYDDSETTVWIALAKDRFEALAEYDDGDAA